MTSGPVGNASLSKVCYTSATFSTSRAKVGNASLSKVCYTSSNAWGSLQDVGNASLSKVCYTIDKIIIYHINSKRKLNFWEIGVKTIFLSSFFHFFHFFIKILL